MATTLVEQPADETLSVGLQFHGRRFATDENGTVDRAQSAPIRELSDEEIATDLPSIVAADLYSQLRFLRLEDSLTLSGEEIIAAYVASLDQLNGFRRDAEFLVEAVCLSHMEFDQVSGPTDEVQRESAEKALLESMLNRANLRLPAAGNIATAELLAGPQDELRNVLAADLEKSTVEFAKNLFELFNRLVDEQLAGLFEWSSAGTCWYHFFREIIRQENGGTTTKRSGHVIRGLDSDGEEIEIRRVTITSTTSGNDTIRIARHEHHVMNAYQTSLENSKVVIPLAVQEMIAAIPGWLAPYISVIDGTLFREQIISRDYRTSDWSQVRVSTVDLPVHDGEPAVLIGNVVLAGWGPTEIAKELERRAEISREQSRVAQQELESKPSVAPYVPPLCHVAAVLMMVLAFRVSPGWIPVSVSCSLFGFWMGIVQKNEAQRVAGRTQTKIRNTFSAFAMLIVSAAAQSLLLGLMLPNGSLMALALVCLLMASIIAAASSVEA